jgi:hypothetical protein
MRRLVKWYIKAFMDNMGQVALLDVPTITYNKREGK